MLTAALGVWVVGAWQALFLNGGAWTMAAVLPYFLAAFWFGFLSFAIPFNALHPETAGDF
ncbi:MAG: hypothetical protein ABI475_04160 [Methylophilaceae bacterium]